MNSEINVEIVDTTAPKGPPKTKALATQRAMLAETRLPNEGIEVEKRSDITVNTKKSREACNASLLRTILVLK